MAKGPEVARESRRNIVGKLLTSTAIICIAAACSPISGKRTAKNSLPAPNFDQKPVKKKAGLANPLHVATTYWATEYQKDPTNAKAALSYATNLKTIGAKEKARSILQQAHRQHPDNAEIASAYGRLVLEKGHTKTALRILDKAEKKGGKTDWKVLSAKGTAHAKLGEHALAQQYYKDALKKNPESPSLLNNLALSYAMSGKASEAEPLLRKVIKSGHDTPRVRQNLALVLGLQQKYDEGTQLASVDLPKQRATSNMDYLRSMVQNAPVTTASIEPADQKKSKPAKKAKQPNKKVAKAGNSIMGDFKWPEEGNDISKPMLSSLTMPLPWTKAKSPKAKATGNTKTATAKTVPLPDPKPKPPRRDKKPAASAPSQPNSGENGGATPILPWLQPDVPSQEAAVKESRKLTSLRKRHKLARASSWQSSLNRR